MVYRPSKEQLTLLQQAERITLMLDKAIQSGEISDDDTEKAQVILNKLYKKLEDDEESLGSKAYIMYEAQALLAWIGKNKDETRKLLDIAVDIKGDGNLFTESATDLLELLNIENEEEANKKSKNINPLWIFLLGVVFLFIGNSLGGIIGAGIGLAGDIFLLVGIIQGIIYLFKKKGMNEQNKKSEISRNDAKKHYTLLETNKSWRLVKVIYFIITAVLALILLGAYNHDSETWVGFFITIILIYPGYLLVRKLFMYISGTES